ncbi:MAG: hypothetical protein H7Y60_16885 [Rhodospirillaceae bacterium]|nr:hypothetical protein [Rhodospirillales bacterium]
MKERKGYRISGWSIFALVAAPFAIAVAVVFVAALEQPQAITQPQDLKHLVLKLWPAPSGGE